MTSAPGRAVARLVARQVRWSALAVAAAVAGMSALVVSQYATFSGAVDGSAVRALANSRAVRVLFGPPVALDDPAGFAVWRTGTSVLALTGIWAILAATRLSRGEEDSGRWDLLLAGRVRVVDLVARIIAAFTGCALLIGSAVVTALLATGAAPTGAVLHAAGVAGATLTYATAGVLAAQLLPTRAAATGTAVCFLAVGLLVRMVADGVPALAWTAWLSPFGLTSRSAPFADDRLLPVLVLAVFPVLLAAAATAAARNRDLGGAHFSTRTTRRPRTRLLHGLVGFAVRRALRTTTGWAAGIGAYFLFLGVVLPAVLEFMRGNPRFTELAATVGFSGLDTATGLVAALFGLLAVPAGLYAVTVLATFADDEKARRLAPLYALPITRTRLLGTEVVVGAVGVLVLLATAAVAVWLATAATSGHLRLGEALAGALNAAPVAWLALGAAALALGWHPPAVAAVGALPVVGGFLLTALAPGLRLPAWLTNLSPFAHLAAVPATPPDWTATAVLTATAAALCTAGLVGYEHRDLRT